jgi:hypothetical protein
LRAGLEPILGWLGGSGPQGGGTGPAGDRLNAVLAMARERKD